MRGMPRAAAVVSILFLSLVCVDAQRPAVTSPRQALGFELGDDYQLANYKQIEAYWKTLDKESDRMVLHDMGRTAEGRTQWMAIVTSPQNHRNLARYRDISRRLALADGLTDEGARALAKEGKAVVWIDGGLHATETLGAQQLAQMVYEMVSRDDQPGADLGFGDPADIARRPDLGAAPVEVTGRQAEPLLPACVPARRRGDLQDAADVENDRPHDCR
jgi:hypothetical protein